MIDPPSRYVNFIEHAIKGTELSHNPLSTPLIPHSWGSVEAEGHPQTPCGKQSRPSLETASFSLHPPRTGSQGAPAIVRQFLTDRPQEPPLSSYQTLGESIDSTSAALLEYPTTRNTIGLTSPCTTFRRRKPYDN